MLCIVRDLPEIAQSSKNIIMLHVLDANYFPINWGLADIKRILIQLNAKTTIIKQKEKLFSK